MFLVQWVRDTCYPIIPPLWLQPVKQVNHCNLVLGRPASISCCCVLGEAAMGLWCVQNQMRQGGCCQQLGVCMVVFVLTMKMLLMAQVSSTIVWYEVGSIQQDKVSKGLGRAGCSDGGSAIKRFAEYFLVTLLWFSEVWRDCQSQCVCVLVWCPIIKRQQPECGWHCYLSFCYCLQGLNLPAN